MAVYKRRSSENKHPFEAKMFNKFGMSELQGLLVDAEWHPTVGLEAIEVTSPSDFEKLKLNYIENIKYVYNIITSNDLLTHDELRDRLIFTQKLSIPFYLVFYIASNKETQFILTSLSIAHKNNGNTLTVDESVILNEDGFINWWNKNKGTVQCKPFTNGAGSRVSSTYIDRILEKHGLKWGGNIDAFLIDVNKEDYMKSEIKCIIDFLSCSRHMEVNADPRKWYNDGNPKHGPKYEGFKTQSTIASILGVPHLIIYIDKSNKNQKKAALSSVKEISPDNIILTEELDTHKELIPCHNIKYGMQEIGKELNRIIKMSEPPIIK